MTNAKDDAAADLLIREVDEDLRQENLTKIWKKYGALMVAGAVSAILAVAGTQAWQTWRHNQNLDASQRFTEALSQLDQGDKAKGIDALQALAGNGTDGYRLLAEMKLAQVKLTDGDSQGAIALYDKVAVNGGVDDVYRNMALLKSAYLKLSLGEVGGVEPMVTPLAAESSPWRHSAREVLALLALKGGDTAKAQDWLRKIADDVAAPAGVRGRAAELLAALESAAKG